MKKLVVILLLIGSGIGAYYYISSELSEKVETESQLEGESQSETETEENALILGEFELQELKNTNNKQWFEAGYQNYTLNPEVVDQIKSEVEKNDCYISAYMGTWCEDSQREIPALIKLLDHVNFDYEKLTLVGVDEDKVIPNISEEEREKLNVLNVPTIIVYNSEGQEINRFVEFPQESLEKDLLKILSGEDYQHVYDF